MKKLVVSIALVVVSSLNVFSQSPYNTLPDGTIDYYTLLDGTKFKAGTTFGKIYGVEETDKWINQLKTFNDSISKVPIDTLTHRFARLLNQYRKTKGLCSVTVDSDYTASCKWMIDYMSSTKIMEHDIKVPGMETPWVRISKFTSKDKYHNAVGEVLGGVTKGHILNIMNARKQTTVEQYYLEMWLYSAPHRKILLDPNIKVIGAALSKQYGIALVGKQ
jgi:uncharacterized protein YkwD